MSRSLNPSGPILLINSITPRHCSRKRTGTATIDCVSIFVLASTCPKNRESFDVSGTTTALPVCATHPASPCPTLMRTSFRDSAPLPVAIWKYSSLRSTSISNSDQVSGRNTSLILSMIVRSTWSSCSDDVRALPSSRNTVTSLVASEINGGSIGNGILALGAVGFRRRSTPSNGRPSGSRRLMAPGGIEFLRSGLSVLNLTIIGTALRHCNGLHGSIETNRQHPAISLIPGPTLTHPPPTPIFFVGRFIQRMSSTPFGEHLKREREMRGVSLEEISLATRIAPRFLAALEREEWEKLPGGVFNRGFIRSVAHYLGLDEDSMVAEYALHTKGRPEPGVVADPPDEPETQWRQIVILVVFAVVVIAAGWAAIQYLVPRVTEYMHKRSSAISTAKVDASAAPLPLNALPPNSDPAIVSAAPPVPSSSAGNPAAAALALKIQATRAADINIVADGKTIFSGRLNPGDAKDFNATDSIQISSSEASAVLLDLNGKMVVLPGQPGQPGAITLTQKDLPPPPGASH